MRSATPADRQAGVRIGLRRKGAVEPLSQHDAGGVLLLFQFQVVANGVALEAATPACGNSLESSELLFACRNDFQGQTDGAEFSVVDPFCFAGEAIGIGGRNSIDRRGLYRFEGR